MANWSEESIDRMIYLIGPVISVIIYMFQLVFSIEFFRRVKEVKDVG